MLGGWDNSLTGTLHKFKSTQIQFEAGLEEQRQQQEWFEKRQENFEKQQEEFKEQVMKMEQQQDGTIKKAVEKAFTEGVAMAVANAIAIQLPEAVARQVPGELKKVVAEQLPVEVQKVVDKQLPEEIKKVQKAIKKDAENGFKEAITKNDTDFKKIEAEFKESAAKEMKELRDQVKQSEDSRQRSEKQFEKLAKLADELADTLAKVQEAAGQAKSASEADEKLQQAPDEKQAAESVIASLQEKANSNSYLLEQQEKQLKRMHHHFGVQSPSDLMDLDGPAYPSPNSSEGVPQTPSSWSQSHNSTGRFTSSTSSTTNDGSAHDRKPRQAMRWTLDRGANPFTNQPRRKVIDTENIAMEDHSRMGYSKEPPSSDESDEELPTSNAPSSQYRQFQSPTEQSTGSFGRPSASYAGSFNGAGQSNSHRAPRSTPFPIDYSQQHGHDLRGAEQSYSRRESRPSRTEYAAAGERATYPPRHTPRSQGQTNYAHQNHNQQQHHGSKRVRFSDDTHHSNFNHQDSPFAIVGRGGRGGSRGRGSGRGRGGSTLRDLAPLTSTPQTPSSYVASPSHHQDRHTQRGQAPYSHVTQLPSSYEDSPEYNYLGRTPTGPARHHNTAQTPSSYVASSAHSQGGYTPGSQPPTFQKQSQSQKKDPYKADREANRNKRVAVEENLRAPQFHGQSQRQQQPQQPQHNSRSTMNRNGHARNEDLEDSRGGRNNNTQYAPPTQPQGHGSFGRTTPASSSRSRGSADAGVRPSIEDEGEAQTARDEQQFAEKMRHQKTLSMAQPGAQQTNTPRTPAPSRPQPSAHQDRPARAPAPVAQSFRDARGLSREGRTPEITNEGLSEILASKAPASRSSNVNKGPSQKPAKSASGSMESRTTRPSENDGFSAPHSFNDKKRSAQNSANPTGGDLFSRVTFPSDEDDFSASHSSNNKGKGAKRRTREQQLAELDAEMDAYQAQGPSQDSANPTRGDLFSRTTFPPKEDGFSGSHSSNGRKGKGRASDTVIPNIGDSFNDIADGK